MLITYFCIILPLNKEVYFYCQIFNWKDSPREPDILRYDQLEKVKKLYDFLPWNLIWFWYCTHEKIFRSVLTIYCTYFKFNLASS